MSRTGAVKRGRNIPHSTHSSEAQRIEEQRAAYATGTTGTVTAVVLMMEKEMAHS